MIDQFGVAVGVIGMVVSLTLAAISFRRRDTDGQGDFLSALALFCLALSALVSAAIPASPARTTAMLLIMAATLALLARMFVLRRRGAREHRR